MMVPEPEEDRVGVGQGRLCVCRGGMLGTGAGDRLDTRRPARRQRGLVAHRTVTAALRLRNLGVKLGSDGRQEAAAAGCRGGEPYEDKG